MSRKRGNFDFNYPRVIKFLRDNRIDYIEYAGGQHLKILGAISAIDLWPSKMTAHVIMSEETHRVNEYRIVNINQLKEILT
jgi:hypothetical protein